MQFIKDLSSMLLESRLYEKSNRFHDIRPDARQLAVDDWVYYIPKDYIIRKSRIKEMHVENGRWPLDCDRCRLLLENGVTVNYDDTFNTLKDAQEYIARRLRLHIDCHKRQVASLQREIKLMERLLGMYDKAVCRGK